jgi:hypothetical protein
MRWASGWMVSMPKFPTTAQRMDCNCLPLPARVGILRLYYHIDKILCMIGICIDNQHTIQYLHDMQIGYDSQKYDANADLLSIIEACLKVVAQLRPRHVKSHHDKTTPKNELSNDAKTSVLCNHLAKISQSNVRQQASSTKYSSDSSHYQSCAYNSRENHFK